MKTFALVFAILIACGAHAQCVCRCSGGENVPFCSSTLDIPPICSPRVCPIAPPSIAPLPSLRLPPLGTSECRQQQVLNPYTNRYEWKSVCR
jgi:hypothetical protein